MLLTSSNSSNVRRYSLAVPSVCLSVLLAACGGGSSGNQADVQAQTLKTSNINASPNASPVTTDVPPTTTEPTTTEPAPTPTTTTTTTTAPTTRNPLKWPFASNSIWNMPIGSGAVFKPANLPATPGGDVWAGMPQIDDELIVLRPSAPNTAINYSSAGWTGASRCSATGGSAGGLPVGVPIPSDYVVPSSKENNSASFLSADGRTIVQTQPFTRCQANGYATSIVKFPNVDLYGTGITGAHGGSGLSAIGGSIRVGELRPGQQGPRHALKINVYAKQVLYKCTTRADCSRWPATKSDSYAVGFYGTASNNGNTAMKMGALLAIPPGTNIANLGLETAPAKQLAWTLQNYGAYIVDDTYSPAFHFNVENGPDGSLHTQFQNDWGITLEQRVRDNTPWVRDIQRLTTALQVVDNNTATSIGGGGTPRQPLAPPLHEHPAPDTKPQRQPAKR
jgi:hypothetical protein